MEQAKKIAILLPSMQIGGAERLVLEELSFMKDDPRFAFEVHLVFEKGPFYEEITRTGLPVFVWNATHKSIRMLKSYMDIVRHLRRTDCDILHCHLLDNVGPLVGKLAGARVVSTVHSDKKYSFLARSVLATSDLVLACGAQVKKNICGFVTAEKVYVLNNATCKPGIGNFLRNDVMNKYGFRAENKLVLSLGRLIRAKGFDVLIEAFQQVVAEVPEAVLLIGGDGEERNYLISLVNSTELKKYIKIPGMISEINEVLATCDIYVNSSRWEGLPMTLLESMSYGKPMIATNVGGNSEVVHDGGTGLLVPPNDPLQLANAIIRMLKDDSFREEAGKAAFTLYLENYSIEKHCESLSECYFQVLNDKVPGRGKTV